MITILAIDQGTSSTKALVVAEGRGVIASAEVAIRPRYDVDSVEQDPGELIASVIDAGREAVRASGEPITAIGLANQGETVLAWDRSTGEPLTPAIGWQDRRATETCRCLEEHRDALAALTGLPLDAYFAAPKMRWLRDNLTQDGVVTTSDSWLIHQLTGEFVTDAATASRTMLLDLDTTEWSPEAVGIFELEQSDLPDVVDCSGQLGETSAFTGSPVAVTGLAVDQQAALYGQGCVEPASAKCTYGTGAFLLANIGASAQRPAGGLSTSVAWRLDGTATYCLDGQVYTAASAVRWLTDLGLIRGAADLDAVGASVPDNGGVTFVPALAGLGAPWWQPEARGTITGISLDTSTGHLVRALVEGIAAQVAELVETASSAADLDLAVLKVDGGLTRSALLMQAQADLLQTRVEVSASPDATAIGVADLAALAVPGRGRLMPAAGPSAVYEPAISADEAAQRRERFRAVALTTQERR